jgi:hypothetical protein
MSRKNLSYNPLLEQVDWTCLVNGWAPSRFGREFNGDPTFYSTLKKGRRLRSDTRRRLKLFLKQQGTFQ